MSPKVLSCDDPQIAERTRRVPAADVFVRESVLQEMTDHADDGLADDIEVLGLLIGRVYRDARGVYAEIHRTITGDLIADRVGVRFDTDSPDAFIDAVDSLEEGESIVGWYHSHLDFGCGLSDIDIKTQASLFKGFGYAAVVDPVRGEFMIYASVGDGIETARMIVTD